MELSNVAVSYTHLRNYAAHAEELNHQIRGGAEDPAERSRQAGGGADTLPERNRPGSGECSPEPIWFLKPDTALLRNNDPFYIPAFSHEVHYECELVVRIDRVGKSIAERFAHRYYKEVGLGIDFTARDLQRQAAAEGLPWERSKAFDRSAAISPEFVSLQELDGDVQKLRFTLEAVSYTHLSTNACRSPVTYRCSSSRWRSKSAKALSTL